MAGGGAGAAAAATNTSGFPLPWVPASTPTPTYNFGSGSWTTPPPQPTYQLLNSGAPVPGQSTGGMSNSGKMFLAAQALSGLSQIAGGLFGAKAAGDESALIDEQAALAEEEAAYEAEQRARDVRKFQAKQESKYLASGVTLAGSPALVLEETRQLGQQEIDAIMRRGQAQAKLLRMKGKQTKSAGRAGILSSLLGAGAGGFQAYMYGKQFGLFGSQAPTTSSGRIDIPETMTPFPGYS